MEILLFSIYTIVRLIWDALRIRKHSKTDGQAIQVKGYRNRNVVLIASMFVIALLSLIVSNEAPFWTRLTYQLGVFVLLFDYGINILTGKSIVYSNPTSNSKYERVRAKLGVYPELMIKIFLAACGISVYYQWELL